MRRVERGGRGNEREEEKIRRRNREFFANLNARVRKIGKRRQRALRRRR